MRFKLTSDVIRMSAPQVKLGVALGKDFVMLGAKLQDMTALSIDYLIKI